MERVLIITHRVEVLAMNSIHKKKPLILNGAAYKSWACLTSVSQGKKCVQLSSPSMCVLMCVQERENACTNAWMRRKGPEREECENHIWKEPQNNEARTSKGCILGQQVFNTRLHGFAGKRVMGTHNTKQVTERRNQTQKLLAELPVISSLCVLSFHFHAAWGSTPPPC